ncbi:hypothetical protein BDP27DRAFT_1368515 [Rhodocollybia butyracea]|uniref:Uncharacterized protein n=1 Tax=Rhodocollybia butyracea TaxID=206335 RepID=A0A9P5PG71_9AGAR|nr:hypothetical protein BDP27DRAFT_1368515 [Rhodocollybia butyracea]
MSRNETLQTSLYCGDATIGCVKLEPLQEYLLNKVYTFGNVSSLSRGFANLSLPVSVRIKKEKRGHTVYRIVFKKQLIKIVGRVKRVKQDNVGFVEGNVMSVFGARMERVWSVKVLHVYICHFFAGKKAMSVMAESSKTKQAGRREQTLLAWSFIWVLSSLVAMIGSVNFSIVLHAVDFLKKAVDALFLNELSKKEAGGKLTSLSISPTMKSKHCTGSSVLNMFDMKNEKRRIKN